MLGVAKKGAAMKQMALCIAGALASAACHSQPQASAANASGKRDAAKFATTAAAPVIQPGQYQYDSHTIEMKIPGMPADYGAKQIAMERSGEAITVVRHCVSREEALDPRLIFSLGDKACHFPRNIMVNGKIDMQLVCRRNGVTETKIVTGTYTPTSFAADVSMGTSGGPQSGAEMKTHVDVRRVGACSEDSR
jgi:hypothetical protein